MNNKDKILITGADGFIGSHLAEALVKKGYNVRAFVLYNSFNSWGWLDHSDKSLVDQMEIISGDVRDPHCVKQAMAGCSRVIHLAALIAIPYSYHAPGSYVATNISGTLNLLQAAKELSIEKFVHTSTSEVYGTAQMVPITEDHPLLGQSPYSASKIGADQMAIAFNRSFGLPVSIVRPFNTYGPRQSARAVIPTVITQIASGKNQIELGSLEPTRDFSYIQDTVDGFISVCQSGSNTDGQVMNLGTGFEISIEKTVETIGKIMGASIEIITDGQRIRPAASEVNRLCSDNSKIKKLTGWEPKFPKQSGLEKGLKIAAEWFSLSENLSKYKSDIYNL